MGKRTLVVVINMCSELEYAKSYKHRDVSTLQTIFT